MSSGWLSALGSLLILLRQSAVTAVRSPPRFSIVLDQLYEVGVRSLSIVTLTAVFTGMVMTIQLGPFMAMFGAKIFISKAVGFAIITELGPVLTALMIGGRVGAGMAAELGTMKVTEQIDALRSMGTDPVAYLVVPRMIAIIIMMPLMTGLADTVGVLGGMLVASLELNVPTTFYTSSLLQLLVVGDIVRSLVKGLVFAVIIGSIACHNGMAARNGADGVGRATTQTVVAASITVLVSDFFVTKLMLAL